MARPRILTPELQAKIVALVEAGDKPPIAAGVNGISRSTHYELMASDDGYRTAVTRAIDIFKSESRAVILGGDDKGEGFGRARARLELVGRIYPKDFGQRVVHEIEESNRLTFEELQRVCSNPEVYARVCAEGSLSPVFESFCAGIASLDCEGESPAAAIQGTDLPIH